MCSEHKAMVEAQKLINTKKCYSKQKTEWLGLSVDIKTDETEVLKILECFKN